MRCVVVEMPRIVQCFDFRLNTAVKPLLIFLTMGKETAIRMNEQEARMSWQSWEFS